MTEPKNFVKAPLFLSSFFPLWLIFIVTILIQKIQAYLQNDVEFIYHKILLDPDIWIIFAGLLFLVIIPMIIVRLYIKSTTKDRGESYVIKKKEDITNEFILYVVTYIIPFLTSVELFEISNLAALIILMVTLGIIYTKANMFYVNPALSLMGYRLYKIVVYQDSEKRTIENTIILISKRVSILQDTEIKMNEFSGDIFIENTN
jgi:hypothetical protein